MYCSRCKQTVSTLYTQPLKMELIQDSETSANYNLTPGKYPKENIQDKACCTDNIVMICIFHQISEAMEGQIGTRTTYGNNVKLIRTLFLESPK